MKKLLLTFENNVQERKYAEERGRDCFSDLRHLIYFLISLLISFLIINTIITRSLFENERFYILSPFVVFYTVLALGLRWIDSHLRIFGSKYKLLMHRLPCYIFTILIPLGLAIAILNSTNNTEIITMMYMKAIFYYISSNLLRSWWINLIINIPPILLSYPQLFEYSPLAQHYIPKVVYQALIFGHSFIFLIATFSAYLNDKRFRAHFLMREDIFAKKEKIDDFFNMIPVSFIKINNKSGNQELNPMAEKMLSKYNCPSFEEFSNNAVAFEPTKTKLSEEIFRKLRELNRLKQTYENNVDRKHIQDYILTIRKGLSQMRVEFEIQFLQRKSFPDDLLLIIDEKDEKRKILEEKMANEYKNELIMEISHDLKTPLNGIICLLDGMPAEEKKNSKYEIMNMSAHFLLFKIKDMLDYSQIETGGLILKSEPFKLNQLFSSILQLCRPQAILDNVHLILQIDSQLPELIKGDEARIEQVVIHLVQNAIKYSTTNGNIYIFAEYFHSKLRIGVQDTGPGINNSDKQKVSRLLNLDWELNYEVDFSLASSQIHNISEEEKDVARSPFSPFSPKSAFSQVANIRKRQENPSSFKPSANRESGGAQFMMQGFGLQITNKILNSMDSQLNFLSKIGEGSEFYFLLDNFQIKWVKNRANTEVGNPLTQIIFERRNIEGQVLGKDSYREQEFEEDFNENIKENINSKVAKYISKNKLLQPYHRIHHSDVAITIHSLWSNKSKKVLIVEDNGVNRLALRNLLKKENLEVTETRDGLEAVNEVKTIIKGLKTNKKTIIFDCIFMDLNMPIMDGIEATLQIRKLFRSSRICQIPIFALTAYDSDQIRKECLEKGFNEFLVKPIKYDILKNILKKYLNKNLV